MSLDLIKGRGPIREGGVQADCFVAEAGAAKMQVWMLVLRSEDLASGGRENCKATVCVTSTSAAMRPSSMVRRCFSRALAVVLVCGTGSCTCPVLFTLKLSTVAKVFNAFWTTDAFAGNTVPSTKAKMYLKLKLFSKTKKRAGVIRVKQSSVEWCSFRRTTVDSNAGPN